MSKIDNFLFYKITEEETIFIVLFVDDTLIFSKRQQDIDQFVVRMTHHYEFTLDTKKADSFLGINIGHNPDGTKVLQKLFKEHPEPPVKRKVKTPTPIRTSASPQQGERTVPSHSSDDVLTAAGALDVLHQESTRHHGICLFRGY